MDSLAVLEAFFTTLVALAGLGVVGVGIKVIYSLFKSNR